MSFFSKMSALALLGSFLIVNSSNAASSTYYSATKASSPVSLYGMIDIDVANEYLSKHDLEAVEVAPGKALTGFVVINWKKADFGPVTLKNYQTNALPFLVNRKDGKVRSGYFFGEWSSDSWMLRTVSKLTSGLDIRKAIFGFSEPQGFPYGENTAEVYLKDCPESFGCRENGLYTVLKMGASKEGEMQVRSGTVLDIPFVNPLTSKGQLVVDTKFVGEDNRRPFDPSRDTFWVAPGSVQGDLFARGHFIPTTWSVGKNMDSFGVNPRTFKK